jgi:predicted aminopeptidase
MQGFDTYLRSTAAFSTLGWFADPLLSTVVRQDEVDLVETVLHELAHNHLFVSGHVRFNESFATFVGRVGAADFFCRRAGGGSDTVWCERARPRWRDFQRFSVYLDALVEDLEALYGDPALGYDEKVSRREGVADTHRKRFAAEVRPRMESYTSWSFVEAPLNNAILLTNILYYHRLPDFQALLEAHGGDLTAAVAALEARAGEADDPFDVLPRTALEAGAAAP